QSLFPHAVLLARGRRRYIVRVGAGRAHFGPNSRAAGVRGNLAGSQKLRGSAGPKSQKLRSDLLRFRRSIDGDVRQRLNRPVFSFDVGVRWWAQPETACVAGVLRARRQFREKAFGAALAARDRLRSGRVEGSASV